MASTSGEDVTKNEAGIEMINGTPVYRLRGDLLSMVYLNRELQIGDRPCFIWLQPSFCS